MGGGGSRAAGEDRPCRAGPALLTSCLLSPPAGPRERAEATRAFPSVTPFAEPGRPGYTWVDGPHPFGAVLHLPGPFDPDRDTGEP
ncbi:hypothetical protein GCM10018966_047410 [Streptomyces yanii]